MAPFLAQIQLFAFDFAPQGWLPCNGQVMPITQNTALFSLIGYTYGGDGKTTFGLPTLAPLGPNGPSYFIAVAGIFPPLP
jgi:microcystin-dependent protein